MSLPDYFEALVREEERTVLVTPIAEEGAADVSALAASRVRDGRFTVFAIGDRDSDQEFCWEVKGVRADVPPLEVEIDKPDEADAEDREPVAAAPSE